MDVGRVKNVYDAYVKLLEKGVDWIQGVGIGGSPDNPKVVVLVRGKDDIAKARAAISTMMAMPTDDVIEIMEIGDVRALPFFPLKERGGKITGLDR